MYIVLLCLIYLFLKMALKKTKTIASGITCLCLMLSGCSSGSSESVQETVTSTETDQEINDDGDRMQDEIEGLGFSYDEASQIVSVFRECGIEELGGTLAEGTGTIDDLSAYRVTDKNGQCVWFFTIDHRQLIYVCYEGRDLYDLSKGGFIETK